MKQLKAFIELADGNKTYFIAAVLFVLWLGTVFGWWTIADIDELLTLLGIGGIVAVRSTVKKLEK